jgi:hypothetical protein
MKARLALFALAAAVLAGCGGSGSNPSTLPNPNNEFAGQYRSTMTLDGGKQGTLNLTVSETGSATGTLTVAAASAVTRDPFSFTVGGSLTVSGNVDTDGTFDIRGTDPLGGDFGITGNLPADGNGTGSITVHAGGSTYTSTIGVAMGTGTGSITFSNVSGASISGAAFPSNPYILMSSVPAGSAILVIPSVTDTSRSLGLTIASTVPVGKKQPVGEQYFGEVLVVYGEGAEENVKEWRATSGHVTVVSRTATSVELKLENLHFEGEGKNAGTGTFTINGSIKK